MVDSGRDAHFPDDDVEVARAHTKRALRDAELVLDAAGIPHTIGQVRGSMRIYVAPHHVRAAQAELVEYGNENVNWPPEKPEPPRQLTSGVLGALLYGLLIAFVFWLERRPSLPDGWREAGVMHAGSVRAGEWWRAVTALTLHVDATHLISNILFGGLFGALAAQTLGNGVTWLGTVLAGAGGNALEVLLVDPSHRAVGASTAIFGTLGLMAAAEWVRRGKRQMPWVRRVAPLFAGAVLFGWFGGGGQEPSRVDVLAHATGFAVGALLGAIVGWTRLSERLSTRAQAACCVAALALLGVGWIAAA